MTQVPESLEGMIMHIADGTTVSVKLRFLIETQRYISEQDELYRSLCGEINEAINDMDRGALVNVEAIRKRLAGFTGYEEVPEE